MPSLRISTSPNSPIKCQSAFKYCKHSKWNGMNRRTVDRHTNVGALLERTARNFKSNKRPYQSLQVSDTDTAATWCKTARDFFATIQARTSRTFSIVCAEIHGARINCNGKNKIRMCGLKPIGWIRSQRRRRREAQGIRNAVGRGTRHGWWMLRPDVGVRTSH